MSPAMEVLAPILAELVRKRDEAYARYDKETYKSSLDNWEHAVASMALQDAINIVCRHAGLTNSGLELRNKENP